MVTSLAYSVLESLLKYGILFDPVPEFKATVNQLTESPSCLILLGLFVLPLISLGIEVLLSKGLLSERVGLTLIATLLASEILLPPIILYYADTYAAPTFFTLFWVLCLSMKLESYHVTNFWCREIHTQTIRQRNASSDRGRRKDIGSGNGKAHLVHYPDNLNFKDIYYFVIAPTLCYELNFPRLARIRKTFLAKRILELIFLSLLIVFMIQQCMVPALKDSLKFFQESEHSGILEILLKLVESDWSRIPEILKLVVNDLSRFLVLILKLNIPVSITFLLSAYFIYHSYLNAIAEILRFGDRYFYNEFWNSTSSVDFWQNFNVPVHNWCIRHLYVPLRRRGFTDFQTSTVIFLLSAVFHEYCFSISLKIFRFWSFLFMMIQIPYAMISSKYIPTPYSTMLGPFFIALASSFLLIMYYHDYYTIYSQNV